MPVEEIHRTAEGKMQKSIEVLKHEMATIRTGRASPALLDRIQVDYFGSPTPVNALATVSAPEPRLLTIQPWDRQSLGAIEKAIQKSDLGLNPTNDGTMIRLAIPQLNDERRRDLVKLVHHRLEEARVAIRNERREGHDALRKEEREKLISEDDGKRALDRLQKLTDQYIAQVDDNGKAKEREILET